MPIAKKELLSQFQQNWKKYWDLEILKDLDFKRQLCSNCGKFFWAQVQQEICNDASCRPYEFLGKPPTKKEFDFFQAWDAIKKFFVKEGHTPLERYPVLCKWYPLYFNIAGIVNFYRLDGKKLKFEFPANPSIMSQPCLRFNDIPQVGVSGRHFTCFNMIQQSSLWDGKNGYWKDRTIELDFNLLTKVFGVPKEKINFIEDVWLGAGAFGYSLEYHIAGLEVGNAVFTEFEGTPEKFSVMEKKVVDMGAGHERFCWLSQGTPTAYDSVFGPLVEKFRKKIGVEYDKDFFLKYARLAGTLNADETDLKIARVAVAKKLGVSSQELEEKIAPMEAIYAILDHSRALAFAISDGGLPSNIGGGYNLRVVLRRALSFIDKLGGDFDLLWSAEQVSKFFKPMYPELLENSENIKKIISTEEKRYRGSLERTKKIVSEIVDKKEILNDEKLIELYDSHGITPELIAEVAEKNKIAVNVPLDFYSKVTEKHMKEKEQVVEKKFDVAGLPQTKLLYYEYMRAKEFSARVLKIIDGKFVALDKTLFYPRGGGQEPDFGTLNGKRVYDSEKVGGVIVHAVENCDFKVGQTVKGKIDWERRFQITLHHDATHVINAAARKVLGPWVWQEGSKKDTDKAHLDVDHFQAVSEEEVEKIEELANKIAEKGLKIEKKTFGRADAEKKFGFKIYQGAAVPSDELRIVRIGDFSVEACGGTHGDNSADLFPILITKTERPADGTVRFVYRAGPAAKKYLEGIEKDLADATGILKVKKEKVPAAAEKLLSEWKEKRKELEQLQKKIAEKSAGSLEFESLRGLRILVKEIPNADAKQLQEISLKLSGEDTLIILFGATKEKVFVFGSAGATAVKAGINVEKIVAEACKELGGRGGGREGLAQGNGIATDKVKSLCSKIIEGLK